MRGPLGNRKFSGQKTLDAKMMIFVAVQTGGTNIMLLHSSLCHMFIIVYPASIGVSFIYHLGYHVCIISESGFRALIIDP